MPQGDKSKYTDKQKRQAEHIEEGYEERGLSHDEAERRAWATVNKVHHGGRSPAAADHAQAEAESIPSPGNQARPGRVEPGENE